VQGPDLIEQSSWEVSHTPGTKKTNSPQISPSFSCPFHDVPHLFVRFGSLAGKAQGRRTLHVTVHKESEASFNIDKHIKKDQEGQKEAVGVVLLFSLFKLLYI